MSSSILIVDDEPGVRSALGGVLRDEGYSVDAVDSGEACLDRLSRQPYDVVVLDIWLPRHGRPGHAGAHARAGVRRGGGDHLRPRQRRGRGARHQDGRVRLRREAAVARQDRAGRPQRAAAAPAAGREPGAARQGGRAAHDGRREPGDDAAARSDRDGRAVERPRAHLRRERHRQGAGGAQHPRDEPPPRRAVRRGQLRGHSRGADRERALRPRSRRVHRRGGRPAREVRDRRMAARSSSTRSPT